MKHCILKVPDYRHEELEQSIVINNDMYNTETPDYNHNDVYRGEKYYDTDHNDVNTQADYFRSVVNPKEQDKLQDNVCGLKTRLNCPDFKELLLSHDLCILTETKCETM